MNRLSGPAAFVAGLLALAWIAFGQVTQGGQAPLALVVIGLIAAFYLAGAVELQRYRRDSVALARALADLGTAPDDLAIWLAALPATLRQTVRRRIDGEPVGFAGPTLAPYLAGLLVLLGMLGTFAGMVLTLHGTGTALDSAADLQAVRGALAGPVQGLGLAFGTSIAGVATSAALGLMSALARGERAAAGQALDARIATTLRGFSSAHHRDVTLGLLQRQAELMPVLVDTLRAMMDATARQGRESHEQLRAAQDAFHAEAGAAYAGLAASVDRALRDSLGEGARIAGETIRPVVEATLAGIARETAALHAALADSATVQVGQLAARFEAVGERVCAAWDAGLVRHEAAGDAQQARFQAARDASAAVFEQRSAALLATIADTHADHARGTLAETARLMQAAAEAPRAASEVMVGLRAQLADAVARDNALLDERGRLLQTLATLLDGVDRAALEQRGAIDALVASSADLLERVGQRVGAQVDADAGRLAAAAAQVGGSAVEVASLGAAFGAAVASFGESNQALVGQLRRIEGALDKSLARSDEQLAYYVAQAREVVDLSILSQRQIIENLQRLPGRPTETAP